MLLKFHLEALHKVLLDVLLQMLLIVLDLLYCEDCRNMFSNYCTDYFCLLIGKHRAHTIHIHLVTANTMHIHLVTANRNANSKLVIAVQ